MDYSIIEGFSAKEQELFSSVCNHLLGNTFVVRDIYKDGVHVNNPEYTFLVRYLDTVRGYLSLLEWDIYQDEFHGYFYISNRLEANRLVMGRVSTCILLVLRLIYDENSERAGLHQDVLCTVRDLLEKVVADFSIFRQKPNMDEIKRSLKLLENHNIIVRIDGKYSEATGRFTILPTILTAVSPEKMQVLIAQMKKSGEEKADEEAEEGAVDPLVLL
jgi:hypothetical protein